MCVIEARPRKDGIHTEQANAMLGPMQGLGNRQFSSAPYPVEAHRQIQYNIFSKYVLEDISNIFKPGGGGAWRGISHSTS